MKLRTGNQLCAETNRDNKQYTMDDTDVTPWRGREGGRERGKEQGEMERIREGTGREKERG